MSLVTWIPNSDKPKLVCIRDGGDDYEILPGSPELAKIARFKLNYQGAEEVPLSLEERHHAEAEQQNTGNNSPTPKRMALS